MESKLPGVNAVKRPHLVTALPTATIANSSALSLLNSSQLPTHYYVRGMLHIHSPNTTDASHHIETHPRLYSTVCVSRRQPEASSHVTWLQRRTAIPGLLHHFSLLYPTLYYHHHHPHYHHHWPGSLSSHLSSLAPSPSCDASVFVLHLSCCSQPSALCSSASPS
ncbi:hypothetical protein EX30DRAFT_174082 [Ascodesmis nigricans]|uniref:Uncharacterized protein n=1 Tax=Ascodesmis nigricans TaxID=341454 RepID=A0A4V3SHX9_9PEZI|nr:hypothetical protein EX30DRAFT_174082 [Ascodesmis nigricans]